MTLRRDQQFADSCTSKIDNYDYGRYRDTQTSEGKCPSSARKSSTSLMGGQYDVNVSHAKHNAEILAGNLNQHRPNLR